MACIACGKELAVGAKFCRHCGASQAGTPVDTEKSASVTRENTCGKCGADFVATAKFCRSCGAARTQAAEPASSLQPLEPVLTHVVVPPITANIAAHSTDITKPSKAKSVHLIGSLLVVVICVGGVGYWGWTKYLHATSYETIREKVLKEGWLPLKRRNAIKMDGVLPEIQYCYEGLCSAEFVNAAFSESVRQINYYVCGSGYEEGYECFGKPKEFLLVNSDKILEKRLSDKEFASFRKQFIDGEQKKETDVERQAQDQKKWVEEMERRDERQELEEERNAGHASTIPGAQKALRD